MGQAPSEYLPRYSPRKFSAVGKTPQRAAERLEEKLKEDVDKGYRVFLDKPVSSGTLSPRSRNASRQVLCVIGGYTYEGRLAKTNLDDEVEFEAFVII